MISNIKQKVLFLLLPMLSFGQNLTEYTPPSNIKTVRLYTNSQQTTLPIVPLDGQITLEFDDLNADDSTYYYTLERANANWGKSDLFKADYLDGYDELRIQNI